MGPVWAATRDRASAAPAFYPLVASALGRDVANSFRMIRWGCVSIGVEVGFERHSKEWPAYRPNENILLPPLTRVAGGWHDMLVLAMRGS